jgi:hypothetical protein
MMSNLNFTVEWDGPNGMTYKQDFETIAEARMAMALHKSRNARIKVEQKPYE